MALPASLHVHPHFNPEEAAHAASEFVASLDNLPGEVVFLLEEIREKDLRINQLIQRINTRHIGLTKQAKALVSGTLPAAASSTSNGGTSTPPVPPSTPGAALPTAHLTHKDAQALTKIQAEWGKVEILQEEKIKLAERMDRIVSRARERGRAEWDRVGGIEVEDVEERKPVGGGMLGELGGGDLVLPPGGLGSGTDGRPQKKRKPNALPLPPSFTTPIIHPPSSMPPPPAPSHGHGHGHGHGHSRPSLSARSSTSHSHGHSHRNRHHSIATLSDMDADGEGEFETDLDADADADADGEAAADEGTEADDTLYCICQQKSYGEMIGCDNEKCEFEWFHVKCVDISGPLPDTWYCPDCVRKLGLSSSDGKVAGQNRKGRKK